MSQQANWSPGGTLSELTSCPSSSPSSQTPSLQVPPFSLLLLLGTTQTPKATMSKDTPNLHGDPVCLQTELQIHMQHQLNTEQYQKYSIRKENKLKCLMAYLYTFVNSQQKRREVTHPFCMLTIPMHIYVNTHAWLMHIHIATEQSTWPERTTLENREGVTYCKTRLVLDVHSVDIQGSVALRLFLRLNLFMSNPSIWSNVEALPPLIQHNLIYIYIFLPIYFLKALYTKR